MTEASKQKAVVAGCENCEVHKRVEVKLNPCDQSKVVDTCFDSDEVLKFMKDKSLGFKLVTNYIDYNDLDNPVQRLIQTVHAYIVPDLT